jgi:hypothetical protein
MHDPVGQAIAHLYLLRVYAGGRRLFEGCVFDQVYAVCARETDAIDSGERGGFDQIPIGAMLALPIGRFVMMKEALRNPVQSLETKAHFQKNLDALEKFGTSSAPKLHSRARSCFRGLARPSPQERVPVARLGKRRSLSSVMLPSAVLLSVRPPGTARSRRRVAYADTDSSRAAAAIPIRRRRAGGMSSVSRGRFVLLTLVAAFGYRFPGNSAKFCRIDASVSGRQSAEATLETDNGDDRVEQGDQAHIPV